MNSASLASTPRFGAPQGSIATIFGQNLAPTAMSATQVPLPTSLAGVSVKMGSTALPLFYVSPGQINFQVPNQTLDASFQITVQTPTGASDPVVLDAFYLNAPGIFVQDGSGCGPAWVFNVAADGGWSLNSPDNSVEPGGLILILGTGLGYDFGIPDGQPSPSYPPESLKFPNTWKIDVPTDGPPSGENALWIGRAPGLVGVDQFNFKLPDNAIEGCGIPATIRPTSHGLPLNVDSQPVPINIHRGGGKCPALPPPQSYADLTLLKTTTIDKGSTSTTEQVDVSLSAAVGKSIPAPSLFAVDPSVCYCSTAAPDGWVFGPSCPFPAFIDQPVPVGPLSIRGPGIQMSYTPQPTGTAFQIPLAGGSLVRGSFTISAPGGSGAGLFSVTVPVMQDIQFDDPAPNFFIDSRKVFTFQWTGGQDNEVVRMRLRNKDNWHYCECDAMATVTNRSFTIYPGLEFSFLSASSNGELTISVESPAPVPFTASGLTLGGQARWRRVWYYPNVYVYPSPPFGGLLPTTSSTR